MRVAIYARVSTEEQREKQSIQTQLDMMLRWAELEQVMVAGSYADNGVSGTVPLSERPEGARLLSDAQEKKFDTVVLYKLDRLGREARLTLNAVGELEAYGVQIKSLTEPFDTTNPAGRFMLTMLSGVAGFERDTIVERSIAGTERLAREGAWLGGIVPFGYRVEGKDREARLVIAEELIPGLDLSEAAVIKLIYRLSGEEGWSCQKIGEKLENLNVLPTYVRDNRTVQRGKRKQATSGRWTPGRIRSMITNSTYKGTHQYGKRGKRGIIERPVPAIVTPELWEQAQLTLKRNLKFAPRNARRKYLLRGLMRCDRCGHTYVGTSHRERLYYICNGKHNSRQQYGKDGHKCRARSLRVDVIEQQVWEDIEGFLRNPGEVLALLSERINERVGKTDSLETELLGLRKAINAKGLEQDRILDLYRRGLIDDVALERQLEKIRLEEESMRQAYHELERQQQSNQEMTSSLRSAEDLLRELNRKLDRPLSWETKRQIVEKLVQDIKVVSKEKGVEAHITYTFAPITVFTDKGSARPPA